MKTRKKLGLFTFVTCLISAILLLSFSNVIAATLQQQRDALDQQAAAAATAKAQKQKDAAAIQAQISIVANNIAAAQNALSLTEKNITETKQKINDLKDKIAAEEDKLAKEKEKANSVVSSWYMQSDSGLLTAVLSSNSLSDVVTQQEQYTSIQSQIEEIMNQIEIYKSQLSTQKIEQDKQLIGLQDLQRSQADQRNELSNQKNMQNRFLTDTKNAITDLANQQAAAEAKANEIRKKLATIYTGTGTPQGSGLISSVDSSWYYNQQWYNTPLIGPNDYQYSSPLTISDAGCLVTSLAMVATKTGHPITPPGIVNSSHFVDGGWQYFVADIGVTFYDKRSVNWDVVNNELAQNRPVIVSVYTGRGEIYNNDGSNHFIVIKGVSNGKYLIHDPFWQNSSYNLSSVKSMKLVR